MKRHVRSVDRQAIYNFCSADQLPPRLNSDCHSFLADSFISFLNRTIVFILVCMARNICRIYQNNSRPLYNAGPNKHSINIERFITKGISQINYNLQRATRNLELNMHCFNLANSTLSDRLFCLNVIIREA